ncbi:DUF937 domain-containing protein [Pannus brasiliensis CCIBt3594]|uniref:DUF937 domain-containing protein n=1 Tax=Pannus brasiliensis CCIBt3594 TaxID=1427578 RepID=A0AAW9QTQ9_9CHRO
MSLVFDILSSINSPDRQGSVEQLSAVTNAIGGLAEQNGIDAGTAQAVVSSLGGHLRSVLGEQRATLGEGGLENQLGQLLGGGGNPLGGLLGQVMGGGSGAAALSALLPGDKQQQIADDIAAKTGLRSEQILGVLPVLVPAVLGLLNMGKSNDATGSNSLLQSFLDSDRDGDTDLGDVLHFANRFLNK